MIRSPHSETSRALSSALECALNALVRAQALFHFHNRLHPTAHPQRDLRPFDEQNERVFALLRIGGAVRLVERRTEDAKVEA